MAIYKALLKYGYGEFILEILEYCSSDVLLQREQYYFDMYYPDYNILKVAGSPMGYRHSEAAKKLIGIASKDRVVQESTRDLKREALLGKNFSEEHVDKMRLGNTFRKSVIVTNTETGETIEFPSLTETGKYLGISRISVSKYLLNNTQYKEFLISAKHPSLVSEDDIESSSQSYNTDRIKLPQQPVLLTNEETGEIKEFSSLTEAAKFLNLSRGRL
jgi:group I intron endonuclease